MAARAARQAVLRSGILGTASPFAGGLLFGAFAATFWQKKEAESPVAIVHNHDSSSTALTVPPPSSSSSSLGMPAGSPLSSNGSVNKMYGMLSAHMRNEFRFGYPGPVNDIGAHAAYVSVYNRALRIPHWVAEHLTRESIKRPADAPAATREESIFTEDANIPPQFRARLVDYTASGFDRGHMAPAADAKRSQQAMDETFLLTNIAPQVGPNFNRAIWADFENFTRDLTKYYDDVYVITGPLFMPHKDPVDGKFYVRYQVIGNPPNVAVPTHWYKAILVTSGPSENPSKMAVGAFIMPNAPIERTTPLKSFAVPLDLLEKSSGLTFFGKLANRYSLPFLCSVSSCDMKVLEFKQKAALK